MYSLLIKNAAGSNINEITNHKGFGYNFELNRAGSCEFTTNIDFGNKFTMANLYPYLSYLDIYRYNTKVWSGVLNKIPSGNVGPETGSINFTFSGYLKLLEKMRMGALGETYTATEQGTILWTMLNNFQSQPNGNYGITLGNVSTGIIRDRTYSAFKNIYDAFIEMCAVIDGCDIEVTIEKVLNVYAHKGHRLNHVFEYGKNISDFSFSIDGDSIVNNSIVVGSGEGVDMLYSIAHNMQSQEKYGLKQNVTQKSDVIILDTLTGYAQGEVNEYGEPTQIFGLQAMVQDDPPMGSYEVGDEIRCIVNKGWASFDKYLRIKKISVDVNAEELETVKVEFQ